MEHLDMKRDDFLAEINRDRDDDNKYDTVTVGAAILQDGKKVLLLQRRRARMHFPGFYELPAGKADWYDANLKKALVSGVRRWAGLRFDRVVRPLPAFAYRTNNAVSCADNAFQLNYLVQVKELDEPSIQWQEHIDKCWADKNKLDELEITEEMKGVVMEALKSA
ncbi:hypothetical protein PG985_011649 [Apiospora marii]|uniref:uncharacterized protein n=1 Tax=Apiospora marii TaxID=335849 RepID=UPI0031328CD6